MGSSRGRTGIRLELILVGIVMTMGYSMPAGAVTASTTLFGALTDGTAIEAVTLINRNGMKARIMALGATLQSLEVPGRDGQPTNVALGYATPQKYVDRPNFFGATAGRYANRIAHAQFKLDGKTYHLDANDNGNSLHGGLKGFDKQLWHIASVESGDVASVTLTYTSSDGSGGYPGNLDVEAVYALSEDNVLSVTYTATTDAATIVNITNHTIWNLAGEGSGQSVMGQELTVDADTFTPVDPKLIPTGEIRAVAGTPFDFRRGQPIGRHIRDGKSEQIMIGRGYDHNFVLNDTSADSLHRAARLVDPNTGRVMELYTNQPGVQVYTGNFLDGTVAGTSDHVYRQTDGIALEPQHFPDAPNHPSFASTTLRPGETYRNRMEFRFSVTE